MRDEKIKLGQQLRHGIVLFLTTDVIYYKGQFYVLDCHSCIMLYDVGGDNPMEARQVAKYAIRNF
ncbi:hypothetical protein Dsin_001518 [Dipteronia sinensis]|uniref:Uncharacterized protein n=1 Tax=Dipteronia sinensis TaxID=43782 RepID=A0AAE0B4G4_9ROSI|nr:hypothetical protein Dsin_001518 [Dipteronia sinensis]